VSSQKSERCGRGIHIAYLCLFPNGFLTCSYIEPFLFLFHSGTISVNILEMCKHLLIQGVVFKVKPAAKR